MKKLIITADDYGASENINEGIILGVEKGIINTISAMTNFQNTLYKLKNLQVNKTIGIGVHLNITTGKGITTRTKKNSLCDNNGDFFTIQKILKNYKNIKLDELKTELDSQIIELKKHEIKIDHLSNQHGILSLYPPFFEIVMQLAEKYNVPVRSPKTTSIDCAKKFPNAGTKKYGTKLFIKHVARNPINAYKLAKTIIGKENQSKLLKARNIKSPDLFVDYLWGKPSFKKFIYILETIPSGISELAVHVGNKKRTTNYANGLDTNYFNNREKELELVLNEKISKKIEELNIELTNFSSSFVT